MLIVWTGKERLSSSMRQSETCASVTGSQLVCYDVGSKSSDSGQASSEEMSRIESASCRVFGTGIIGQAVTGPLRCSGTRA